LLVALRPTAFKARIEGLKPQTPLDPVESYTMTASGITSISTAAPGSTASDALLQITEGKNFNEPDHRVNEETEQAKKKVL
jgi:hypothetical protein